MQREVVLVENWRYYPLKRHHLPLPCYLYYPLTWFPGSYGADCVSKYHRLIFRDGHRYEVAGLFVCLLFCCFVLFCFGLGSSFWLYDCCNRAEEALDGDTMQWNEHGCGSPPHVDAINVSKVFKVNMYDAVYQSGCVNLIFNRNNDGCYHILVALLATDRGFM